MEALGMATGRKIRVGMINCDLHAFYYGPLMQDYNLEVLLKYWRVVNYYFSDVFVAEKMRVPTVRMFEIVRVWDPETSEVARHPDRKNAEHLSELFFGRPTVCRNLGEVSDDVDLVFIANCGDNGSEHLRLATPGIRKGVPTFIDKPFAYDVRDARAMAALAQKHRTPILSLSMLRISPHGDRFRRRFEEIAPVEFGTVRGGWVHAINLALNLFGSGIEKVNCMADKGYDAVGANTLACIHLDYGGKRGRPRSGVVLNCGAGGSDHCSYYASAFSGKGTLHSPAIGDFEFPDAAAKILRMIARMVRTHKPQVPYDEMVEPIAIATAARRSQKARAPIRLKDV
jgi:predicted dehydrogenase